MKRLIVIVVAIVLGMAATKTSYPDPAAATLATKTETPVVCFVSAVVLPFFDGPSPWEFVNGRMVVGQVVMSYNHPSYLTEDGWRYVYNLDADQRVTGWVRNSELQEVRCGK